MIIVISLFYNAAQTALLIVTQLPAVFIDTAWRHDRDIRGERAAVWPEPARRADQRAMVNDGAKVRIAVASLHCQTNNCTEGAVALRPVLTPQNR